MATILDKDLTRETTIKKDSREIIITICADQTLKFRLKGMKTGMVSIPIETLYSQLTGDVEPVLVENGEIENKDEKFVSLHDVRSAINVSGLDYSVISKIDEILYDMIEK